MSENTEAVAPPTPTPLGPGDDDPRSPAVAATTTGLAPLAPGADDPRSPAKGEALPATPPLGPGETDGDEPDPELVMIAPAPAGPGDAERGPRHIGVVRRSQPTVVSQDSAAVDADEAQTGSASGT